MQETPIVIEKSSFNILRGLRQIPHSFSAKMNNLTSAPLCRESVKNPD